MTVASFFDKYFGAQKDSQSVPSGAILQLTDGEVTFDLTDSEELMADHQTSGSAGRTLSRAPDLIWDAIMEAAAPLGRRLGREWMRLFAAALFGKTAGVGDWSALSAGETKTRIGATMDEQGNRTEVGTLDGS